MRVVLFGNNRVSVEVATALRRVGDEIVGLVVHAPAKQKFVRELVLAAGTPAADIVEATRLHDLDTLAWFKRLAAPLGLSVLFDHKLDRHVRDAFPGGVLNLHPAFLPYNRGQYPNVWSIVERTPAGATLHYMDDDIDTGPILARRSVDVLPTDTGETLYRRLERACVDLFVDVWPTVRAGAARATPQDLAVGSVHRARDVERIDRIDLERSYRAGELIDIIRARTFPPHRGAYFMDAEGRPVYLRLRLLRDEELDER